MDEQDRFEIIDAFVDGELVDPGALKQALADAAGRDHLVDAWLLRDAVQEELAADAPMPMTMPRPVARPRHSWKVAAAIAGISLLTGYLVGISLPNVFAPPTTVTVSNPAPDRGKAGGKSADVNIPATSFPVPTPTRVIRMDVDATWREGGGGE